MRWATDASFFPSPADLHEARAIANRSFVEDCRQKCDDACTVICLSVDEENGLRMFYERKTLDICKLFKFSLEIQVNFG